MFTLRYKKHDYKCNKSSFEYNPTKATVVGTRPHTTVTCQNENQTRKASTSQCSTVTYNNKVCNGLPAQYHNIHQKYYEQLYELVQPYSSTTSKYNKYLSKDYSYEVLNNLHLDLQAALMSMSVLQEYNLLKNEGKRDKYWMNILTVLYMLDKEIQLRAQYKTDCTCVGDQDHINRLILCQNLYASVHSLHLLLLRHEVNKTPIINLPFVGSYQLATVYTVQELFTLFSLWHQLSSEYTTFQLMMLDCTSLFKLAFCTSRFILPLNTKASRQLLDITIGPFYSLCTVWCKKMIGEMLKDKLKPIFEDINTYHSNGISCVKYDTTTNLPTDVRINYDKLYHHIKSNYNVEFSGDSLKHYIEESMMQPSYKACLSSWYQNEFNIIVDLCAHLDSMSLPTKKRELVESFCTVSNSGGLIPGLTNLIQKDPTGFQSAWRNTKSLKQTLDDGSKPTYVLKDDFSNLSLLNISALVQSYYAPFYLDKAKHDIASVPTYVQKWMNPRKRKREYKTEADRVPEGSHTKSVKVYSQQRR